MFQQLRFIGVLCGVLMLSACGGGGGNGSGPLPDMGGSPRDASLTPRQVRTQFTDVGKTANRLMMTGLQVWYDPGGTDVHGECFEAARCTPGTDEFGLIFTPANLSAIPRNATIRNRASQQGVPLVEYSGTSSTILQFGTLSRPSSVDYRTLGGWMEYSFFTVNHWTFAGTNWQIWNGASTGMESGSNPVSGLATWTGGMVGRTRGGDHEPGVLVTGDSRLSFDVAANRLDVALTGIRSNEGQAYGDLIWSNLPVANGVFGTLSTTRGPDLLPVRADLSSIRGAFYGPNHEEVGGVFERNQLIGAFGATRQ